MNSRLLLFKSILAFVCCVFISTAAVAQSGNNQITPDAHKGQQVTSPSNSNPVSLSEQVKGKGASNQVNKGTISNDDPGITDPPASYYQKLEDQKDTIKEKMNSLDPESQEHKNLDRKLKSIEKLLKNH